MTVVDMHIDDIIVFISRFLALINTITKNEVKTIVYQHLTKLINYSLSFFFFLSNYSCFTQ